MTSANQPKGLRISSRWAKPAVAIGKGTTHLVVTIAAPRRKGDGSRQPLDVAFVIDRSGSMSGEPLELAKRGVIEAIQQLRDSDQFAVIGYDDQVQDLVAFQPATDRNKLSATTQLRDVYPGGSTNLFGGWQHGVHRINGFPVVYTQPSGAAHSPGIPRLKRAIVLSDGLANVGETNPATISHHVSHTRRFGVTTSTLGLGQHVDDMLLAGMAEAGGGNYAFAATPQDLPGFFARELGEALQVVATGVTVQLTLPKGVRAELLDPFPVEREGKTLTVAVGELPSGMTLNLVFAITTRAKEGRIYQGFAMNGTWRGSRGADRSQAVPVGSLMAMDAVDFDAMPFDPEAQSVAAEKISAHARREAAALYQAGRGGEARQNLLYARQMLASSPNAAMLNVDIDALSCLDESAPDFAMQRRVAMNNAHRDARGRER